MATVVIPYRGPTGKTRLALRGRDAIVAAMLDDVVAAATPLGRTLVVGPSSTRVAPPGELVPDPGGGQAGAVAAGLGCAGDGPVLIANADLPCARTEDLLALLDAIPAAGLALVAALDGTTNALAFSHPILFEPLYGPGSSKRFLALAPSVSVAIPNLVADVDTPDDLAAILSRAGAHTRAAAESLGIAA